MTIWDTVAALYESTIIIMRRFLLTVFALLPLSLFAQGLYEYTPDARIAAMGGAAVATRADAFAVYGNAASALMEYKVVQASFSYTNFAGDYSKYTSLAGGAYVRFAQRHSIVLGLQFNNEPKVDEIIPTSQRYDLGYGYRFSERISAAVTARFRRTNNFPTTEQNYIGGGVDLAIFSRLPMNFVEGAVLNVGGKLSIDNPLAPHYGYYTITPAVGTSLSLPFSDSHLLDITTEVKYGASKREDIFAAKIGAEYSLMRLFYLRAGGNIAKVTDLPSFGYGTFGVGVRFFHLQFDIAYLVGKKSLPMHNAVQINFGLDF